MTCFIFPPARPQALAARAAAAGRAGAALAAVVATPTATMLSVRAPPASTASGLRDRGFGDRGTRIFVCLHRVRTRSRRGSGEATVSEPAGIEEDLVPNAT